MDEPKSSGKLRFPSPEMPSISGWEGKSALLYTKEDSVGMPVRIIRFLDSYVEVQNSQGRARLYPRENIAYFQFLGG